MVRLVLSKKGGEREGVGVGLDVMLGYVMRIAPLLVARCDGVETLCLGGNEITIYFLLSLLGLVFSIFFFKYKTIDR